MAEDYPDREIVGYPMDAGDRSAIDHVVDQVLASLGAIDILVNNAAVNILGSIFGATQFVVHEAFEMTLCRAGS